MAGYTQTQDGGEALIYKVISNTDSFYAGSKKVSLDQRIIITYSEKRAKKDAIDRGRAIEKAEALLKDFSKIKASNRRGAKKYIKQQGENINYFLDEAAIEKDSRFDGYYAIATNQNNMPAEDIISAYHNLWKIEQSFRQDNEIKP